jgi:hypothetical protein
MHDREGYQNDAWDWQDEWDDGREKQRGMSAAAQFVATVTGQGVGAKKEKNKGGLNQGARGILIHHSIERQQIPNKRKLSG